MGSGAVLGLKLVSFHRPLTYTYTYVSIIGMKRTAEEAAVTKQKLLEAALSVFSRQGYKSARLQDIATEADVTRGAIYHHFGNKAGLFMTLIQEAIQRSSNIVPQAIHEGGTFLEIMERIMVRGFELLETDVQVRQTMRLYLFHTEVDDELSMFDIFLKEQTVGTVQNAAQFMQMGITQGVLRQDLDVETAARAFVAFQNGVIHLWLLDPEAFSIREQASALAGAFLHGLVHRERV